MKIDPLSTTKVFSYLNSKDCPFEMKLHDWRVFIEWFSQNEEYDISGIQIQNRTGIDRTNISKAFKRLKDYGILEETGKKNIGSGKAVIVYFFTSSFKEKVEKHWCLVTGVQKQAKLVSVKDGIDCEASEDMLDIPIEEFQGVVDDAEWLKEINYTEEQ